MIINTLVISMLPHRSELHNSATRHSPSSVPCNELRAVELTRKYNFSFCLSFQMYKLGLNNYIGCPRKKLKNVQLGLNNYIGCPRKNK